MERREGESREKRRLQETKGRYLMMMIDFFIEHDIKKGGVITFGNNDKKKEDLANTKMFL